MCVCVCERERERERWGESVLSARLDELATMNANNECAINK